MTYLLDTNVISELRKHSQANSEVQEFLQTAIEQEARIYISVITLGELRRGVELMRHRGDHLQANLLERWLQTVVDDYADHILDFTYFRAGGPHHSRRLGAGRKARLHISVLGQNLDELQ